MECIQCYITVTVLGVTSVLKKSECWIFKLPNISIDLKNPVSRALKLGSFYFTALLNFSSFLLPQSFDQLEAWTLTGSLLLLGSFFFSDIML